MSLKTLFWAYRAYRNLRRNKLPVTLRTFALELLEMEKDFDGKVRGL